MLEEAKAIQVFDLLYPFIYAAALAGGCVAAARTWDRLGSTRLAATGIAIAWVAFPAAGFDYVENLGLDVSLWGRPASPWPELARVAALLKFGAIGLALVVRAVGNRCGGHPASACAGGIGSRWRARPDLSRLVARARWLPRASGRRRAVAGSGGGP